MGGASNTLPPFNEKQEETRKKLQETVESFSAASIKGKALNMVFQGLSMAGNMLIFAAISKGISLAATAIDNFIHRSEIAQEKMEETKSNFNSVASEFKSMESELDSNNKKITELENKGPLTYLEQKELNRLRDATSELEHHLNIKKQLAEYNANELSDDTKQAFDLKYDDDSFTLEDVEALGKRYSGDHGHLSLEQMGLEGTVAALIKMQEANEQAIKDEDQKAIADSEEAIQYYSKILLQEIGRAHV